MNFREVVNRRRSIRKYQQKAVPAESLRNIMEQVRLSPTAANLQRLRYKVVSSEPIVKELFALTVYGAMVKPRRSPVWGVDAPQAFVAVMAPETSVSEYANAGAAIQTLMLAATEEGLGSCWVGAFDKQKTEALLEVPEGMNILYVVALGYAAETPMWEDGKAGELKYYLDETDRLHVPKLTLDQLVDWR